MFNPERTLIICKTSSEYTEFSNLEVEYLFRTLIEFGGKLAKCKKIAYFNKGKIKSEISRKLSDLGVTIKFVEPLDEFYPFYKTALLEEVASEDFDNLIMLDSDVIVTGDFSDQIEEVIRAKPEDIDPLSTNQWMSLFNYFKLEMPTERYKTSAMCGETTTYFNVGVILVPKKYLKTLSRKWKTYGKKLFKEKLPSGISEHSRYFEQISLTLALVDTKLPFKPLSIEMNYPYIGYINNFEKPENLKPLLIHHHHCITETGHIMYCPYTNINRIVDQVNDYLTKGKDIRIADEKIKKANFTIRNLVHLEQYQEVINRISELPTNSDNAEMQYYLALSLHMTGQRLEEAIERYTTALNTRYYFWRFSPFWIYYNRGSLYYRIGNIEKAENDLNKALEIDPRHVGAIEVLDLINKEKKSSTAIQNLIARQDYQEVINRISELPTNSDNAEMQYYLALSLHMTGQRLEEAIERYTTALEKGFLPFWIYYNRGSLYYRIGNIEKAENDLNKALEIDPRHVGAIEVLDLINKEKKSSQNYSN